MHLHHLTGRQEESMLTRCATCTTAYAVGLDQCPNCGGTDITGLSDETSFPKPVRAMESRSARGRAAASTVATGPGHDAA